MKTGEASATAISTARARAAHLTCYAGPKIHEETFALRLTGDTIDELQQTWRPAIAAQRAAAYFAMRQRFSEERLVAAVERGVRQVVLLRRADHQTVEAASRYFVGQPDGVKPLAGWSVLAALVRPQRSVSPTDFKPV